MRFFSFSARLSAILWALLLCDPAGASDMRTRTSPQRVPVLAHPIAPESSVGIDSIGMQDTSPVTSPQNHSDKNIAVGLLLPLTGKHAELGKALEDAASLALFDKYARLSALDQSIRVELLPKDSGDAPDMARGAMVSALKDGAKIIIGPIFSNATEIATPIAASQSVPVLSLSNNTARRIDGAYMLGLSPAEQAERVVKYAIQSGKKRIAFLAPHTPLGDAALQGARNAATKAGITLVAEAQYSPLGSGAEAALRTLIPATVIPPPIDALLIVENGVMLETLLRALAARDVTPDRVQFLGINLWDDVALLRQINLDGAWIASTDPARLATFESRFRTIYNYPPPRLAGLMYDAVSLAITLSTTDNGFATQTLTKTSGFNGPANGMFRLLPNGNTERNLVVMQVDGATMRVISPAPDEFQGR